MDLVSPRPDITFLRRRLHPGETPPAVAPRPATNFLDLSSRSSGAPAPELIPPKPAAVGKVILSVDSPVVRLDVRQSAIGTLVISGPTAFAWETAAMLSGELHRGGSTQGSDIPTYANRRLVDFYGNDAVVGLRHFSRLRRAVYWTDSGPITATLLDGASVSMESLDGSQVMYLSVIGHVIEIRLEQIPLRSDIPALFGFQRGH
ncbi:MAG: hypothetical protein JWQ43_2332 [Glaciihabitans sp.]|nr:hypothetical protein [Glaciihabitans sp.]